MGLSLRTAGFTPNFGAGLNNFTILNPDGAANATFTGARGPAVSGPVIIVKYAAVANGPAAPSGLQCGAFGFEANSNWSADASTAAFIQIVPAGTTTLQTAIRIEGSSATNLKLLPKTDNILSLGDDINDGIAGNTFGRRFADVRAYNISAVGAAGIPVLRGQRINAAGASPANGDCLTSIEGQGWTGTQYVAGGQLQFFATENWTSTNWGTQLRVLVAPVGGGVPSTRFVFNADVFRGATDNTQDIGLIANRIKNVFGYVADFTTKLNINSTQVVSTRRTGWATWTGTANRATKDTATATLADVAQTLKALIDDLHGTAGHGLIGT